MVINHLERLFVTSDASTITQELEVQHPAAKLLVLAAQAQQQEIGDGTNFVSVGGWVGGGQEVGWRWQGREGRGPLWRGRLMVWGVGGRLKVGGGTNFVRGGGGSRLVERRVCCGPWRRGGWGLTASFFHPGCALAGPDCETPSPPAPSLPALLCPACPAPRWL